MIRAATFGLALTLAVHPVWAQAIEDPFAVVDPLDRQWGPGADEDQLALGEEEPLIPETTFGIERELASLGYDPGNVDGVLDQDSRDAIRAFQADEGLRPTGEPTVELYRRLQVSTAAAAGAADGRLDTWRRSLVGKPVYGDQAGRIGEVEDLVVGADDRVTGMVVAVEGGGGIARVPVPWEWVDHQIGRPTIVLPWTRADVDWLVAQADWAVPGGFGGWRTSWLDGAEAEIVGEGEFGTVEGFDFGRSGQVDSIIVRRRDGGRFYAIPRDRVTVQDAPRRVVIHMPLPQVLALPPRQTREWGPSGRLASPERWRNEDDLQVDLARWENRIDRLAMQRGEQDPDVEELRRSWRVARQRWRTLVQSGGPAWDAERARLAAAMDDLRGRWSELAEATGSPPAGSGARR